MAGADVTSEAIAVPVFLAGVPKMMHSDTPSMESSLLYSAASNYKDRGISAFPEMSTGDGLTR